MAQSAEGQRSRMSADGESGLCLTSLGGGAGSPGLAVTPLVIRSDGLVGTLFLPPAPARTRPCWW